MSVVQFVRELTVEGVFSKSLYLFGCSLIAMPSLFLRVNGVSKQDLVSIIGVWLTCGGAVLGDVMKGRPVAEHVLPLFFLMSSLVPIRRYGTASPPLIIAFCITHLAALTVQALTAPAPGSS
ncbi:hypothetical protein DIPPA_25745 [Diplonema papillatum]|nr:hypothetical protein DIPPA_25745 [Diplonema papillatum]